MNASRTGDGPGDEGSGSWANETLPMAVRKQLLDRDLKKNAARASGGHTITQNDTSERLATGHPQSEVEPRIGHQTSHEWRRKQDGTADDIGNDDRRAIERTQAAFECGCGRSVGRHSTQII